MAFPLQVGLLAARPHLEGALLEPLLRQESSEDSEEWGGPPFWPTLWRVAQSVLGVGECWRVHAAATGPARSGMPGIHLHPVRASGHAWQCCGTLFWWGDHISRARMPGPKPATLHSAMLCLAGLAVAPYALNKLGVAGGSIVVVVIALLSALSAHLLIRLAHTTGGGCQRLAGRHDAVFPHSSGSKVERPLFVAA